MFTRRDFIRIGSASVATLALRPFGLLPAMAQSGPAYRAYRLTEMGLQAKKAPLF